MCAITTNISTCYTKYTAVCDGAKNDSSKALSDGTPSSDNIPWWNVFVSEKRCAARNACCCWKDENKPQNGSFFDNMKERRKLSTESLSWRKRKTQTDALSSVFLERFPRNLWTNIRKENKKAILPRWEATIKTLLQLRGIKTVWSIAEFGMEKRRHWHRSKPKYKRLWKFSKA